jgi:F-type H+-transporting ATPase subunit gamma
MAGIRDIKRQIKSIGNTKKITKAMEMMAAAKMRKATDAVLRTRTYANLSWETVLNLSRASTAGAEALHPLLVKREKIIRVAIILITSNRGLCGGFNTALLAKAADSVKKHDLPTDFIVIGKKGKAIYKYYNFNIAAEFEKQDLATEVKEVLPIAQMAVADYLSGKYDKILVAYTDYVSASKQVPRVRQLLPVETEKEDKYLGVVGKDTRVGMTEEFMKEKGESHLEHDEHRHEYLFEPGPEEVLDAMIPRLIEVQLYQAMLESNASEQSARMNAMHQATEAAGDMISDLTLYYNKARQEKITAEIAEISAGANALQEK